MSIEQYIKELNKKIFELEKRVNDLEIINKKNRRNKLITSIITVVFLIAIILIYTYIISKIYGNYTNLF